jgi:hypothetical protein
MISGNTHGHPDHEHRFDGFGLLKLSALYGANASGKSNLIKAIGKSRNMILTGDVIRSDKYFRPRPENKDAVSCFEFEFETDSTFYSYGFEILISKQRIISEWLHKLGDQNEIIFQRTENKIEHEFRGEDGVRMNIYAEDMKRSSATLFLTEMSRRMRPDEKGLSVFSKTFNWFRNGLRVIFPGRSVMTVDTGKEHLRKLTEMMASFGTGITKIGYSKVTDNENIFPSGFLTDIREDLIKRKAGDPNGGGPVIISDPREKYFITLSENNDLVIERMFFVHKDPNVLFEFGEESEGTGRLYEIISILLNPEDDITYVVDELDLKLHPQLTHKFVELFLEGTKGRKNQLIFTTHESSLMDFKLLRRDEIWFIEKKEDESSALYSLEDFNERTDRKIDKAYLEGRYGGVPVFSTVFPCTEDR